MAAEEDAVKVCVRVRPIIQREQGDQVNLFWKAENSTIAQIDGTRSFNFDRVFNSLETTTQVYQEVAVSIIRSALQGYNGTIFAYGQTSSGKTYTMMGTPDNLGVIPQAVKEVFRIIQEIPNREFLLRVSYMEIYNETVTDLLCDSRKKKPLEIREDFNRNVYVADLTEELVMNPEHVLQWIKKGEKNRHYGETKMNEHSSRSHTIFRMIVESRESNDPGNSENCDGAVMVSHLNLVDLAGSERASQTGAEGLRLKEGCNINRSLFILGQVIKKLSDDQLGAFINYRDSKLTRILQNSLGGNTKTVIICTITPVSFDETLSTLQFASTAKKVKNKPHVNEVLDDEALLKRYRKEIMDLKKQLEDLEASSVSKASAMAKEEHAQLLAVIQQLQKEKEERISNLKNIVVDAAVFQEMSQETQLKRKRRVTWAAEKIQCTLYGAGVVPFDAGSKMSTSFPKRSKMSPDLQTLPENDDSFATEFSDIDETSHVFEDFWDVGSRVTLRGKNAFHNSMIDFNSDVQLQSSALLKESSSPKYKDLEQKVAELENRLKTIDQDYALEVERRASFEKETSRLKQQLEAKEEEKDELVNTFQLEITTLKKQLQNRSENNEVWVGLEARDELEVLDSNNFTQSQANITNSHQSTQSVQVQDNCIEEHFSSPNHDSCQEQMHMLEQKIADLEASNQQNDFVESLQICEALMLEKGRALNELAILQENFDSVVVENESLKQEIAIMETNLQEKNETNEFEILEKETQKEHETELQNKSKVLKEREEQIAELKKDAEVLLKKVRYSDLSTSMGHDSEKLCEEVFQLKQSLDDAETVTRDAQREAAFLRSENIELKEKMDELTLHCKQREKDASASEKQLESEKSNYKRMQADLQKELQCAFNEINQLNGLLAGRVPKDLLSRVELEKKIADFSKQLTNALQEKSALEKEVSYLTELKSLPSEIEQLNNQVQKTSEELHLLQNEKEQSVSLISDQNNKMLEQEIHIEKLTEEVTNTQAKLQQAEQQYSEFEILYEDLQTKCSLADEEIKKKDLDAECVVKEMNDLKQSLEILEEKLSKAQQEREELVHAHQELSSHTNMEDMLNFSVSERDNLQEQVGNLSSLVGTLEQQAERQSELFREKQVLEQKHLQQVSEMEQLQEQLSNLQPLLSILQTENSEAKLKLQELQEEMTLLAQKRDELHSKVEELTAEKSILKQDLNDNIDMSIETQDEFRTTKEELKYQKQLVTDLRKQISDYAEHISVQTESHKETTEASQTNSEMKTMELEANNQSLISEMEVLKERIKSAELTLTTMEGEKNELLQKMYALGEDLRAVTEQRDELENTKNNLLFVKGDLRDEVESSAGQLCELNEELKHLSKKHSHEDVTGQLLEQIQEKEKLMETLKAITDERDQLKFDFHENIEMSIETQEELRNALDKLKEKSQLLDALKSQVDSSNGQTSNLVKDLEFKILHLEEQLLATMTERDQLSEEFRLLTEQKRILEESHSDSKYVFPDKETQDKEVQVLGEILVDEEETNISARLEEAETERTLLKERIDHLQQQMHVISQEREQHQQLIDALKAENIQLLSVQRQTEDERKDSEALTIVIEKLKEQLENTSQQLALKDQEAKESAVQLSELNSADKHMGDLEMLENNLQQNSILLEKMQGEKLDLSDKLCALQEELETVTCYREGLQGKLEIVLGENAKLKEILETTLSSTSTTQEELQRCQELQQQGNLVNGLRLQISGSASVQDKDTSTDLIPFLEEQDLDLQGQLLQKTSEYEQLLQMKNKLEEDKTILNCEVESLTNRMTEAQANLESMQNEKNQTEEQLLYLEEKLNTAVHDRDDLKITQERLIAEMDQCKIHLKENDEMDLGLKEQLLHKTSEFEQLLQMKNKLEEDKNILNCEVENLKNRMTEAQANLESMQSEKQQTEEQLLDLQEKLNAAVHDRDDLKTAQERLIAEMDQLKRILMENDEMDLGLQERLLQKTSKYVQSLQMHNKLEEDQNSLICEVESQTNCFSHSQTTVETLPNEKHQTEEQVLDLQEKLNAAVHDRDDLKMAQERLIAEMDQLKRNLKEKDEMDLGLQEQLLQKTSEFEQLLQTKNKLEEDKNILNCEIESLTNRITDAQTTLESMQNEKHQTEEQLLDLQEKLNAAVHDRDDLKIAQEKLIAEMDQFKRNLKENDEMDLGLQEQLLQKTSEYEKLLQMKDILEEDKNILNCEVASLTNRMTEAQANLESMQNEKHQTKELLDLQEKLNAAAHDRDDLKIAQERLIDEMDQLKRNLKENDEMVLHLKQEIQQRTECQHDLEQTQHTLNNELEQRMKELKSTETQLENLKSDKLDIEKKLLNLQDKLEVVSQEWDDLKASQENLMLERDQLKAALEKNTEMLKTEEHNQEQVEVAAQTETLINHELDQLLKNLNDMESQLATVQREKVTIEEKLFSLQEHMEAITKERVELQTTVRSLQSERDQLNEDLRQNIEMSIVTQVDLRSTQEELQQQRVRVSELTKEISSLEQKSSSLETELYETAIILKEVTGERDVLNQSKMKLNSEVEQLLQQLKDKELALYEAEKEKSEASQKIFELTSVLSSMAEDKDKLNCSREDEAKRSVEMQNDLRRTQEELQQQKERVETMTSERSLLEEKLSSLQRELQENITHLKGAVQEKEMLDQAKQKLSSDIEQFMESLKSKDTLLQLTECEKKSFAQKVLELTEEVKHMSQERDQLQLLKENIEEEAIKLRENFKQLQHQHAKFSNQEIQTSHRTEELLSEIEQLKEKVTAKDASAQQLVTYNTDLQRQVQQYELNVASLLQEQEQFQQLLQRVRSEKENICTNLQDQEKATEQLRESLATCQTELESVKNQRDESKGHLSEKVNEINAMILQLSSLQQQLQQLHQELKHEWVKNNDLCEKVNDLEKEIRVLRLMQNEPAQEEDEISERTEILQLKNQEFKDLMENISTLYANQHSLLSNFSVALQAEVEAQKQSMSALKESMYGTQSREVGTVQTEYIKLNSQLQTLLNKFKVIYRNAAVKEEQYSIVNGYESDLCVVQKKNDELLLQCQSLEQNGTKWSEGSAEELKFCELEFLNHLILKKMEVMKRVEDGFSEVQVTLNSVEADLIEEVKYKKQFLSWLEEFKGLHCDAKKFSEGIIQENRRISGVAQLLAKRLKVLVLSRIKQGIVAYINQLDGDLQEKKEKNKELLQRIQCSAPSGDSNILEEENARLCEKLKNLQAELKKMQCRLQQLENEVTSAKADAKQKGEKASLLQEKLLSSVTETELSEMRTKVSEKEKHLEMSLKEIKALQEKMAQGAAPYRDEIDNLKSQVVKFEMDRMKFSKSTDQQITSLKSCIEYKDECLRKLKEQLRRSQKDTDTTICSDKDGSPSYPLTCGGGSGIVQSTAMLMLQSENAALKREITHYKKKCNQRSRITSSCEDELKPKDRRVETPSNLFSSLTDTLQSSREVCRQAVVSPRKSDIPASHLISPGKTGMHRKRALSPSKAHLPKPQVMSPSKIHLPNPQVMSPNKTLRHSVPASSPGKTGLNRKRAVSPFKPDGQLFSNLTKSPCKKQGLPEPANSPEDKFFERSKSLPYCPSKFFDNSTLGTLPDADIYSGRTTETSEFNNWWDRADKNQNANECKTS